MFGGAGATSAFGAPSTNQPGGMFGSAAPQQPSMFGGAGGATQGTGMFGAKPVGQTSAFGGGATSAFGGNTGASAFGGAGAASGQQTTPQQNQGTGIHAYPLDLSLLCLIRHLLGNPRYSVTSDKEGTGIATPNSHFQTISAMPAYRNFSLEELRVQDYLLGKKVGFLVSSRPNSSSSRREILLRPLPLA